MNEKRIELEVGYLKLLLTLVSAMFGTLTGFIGSNFNNISILFLTILIIIDVLLAILIIILMIKIDILINRI